MLQPPDGPDPQTGNTYHFKIDGIDNQSASGMTVEQMWSLVKDANPDRIAAASGTYDRVSSMLGNQADGLATGAQKLVGAWGGNSADLALGQMQQLHETAANLGSAAAGVASVMKDHAPVLRRCKQEIQDLYRQKQQLNGQLHAINQQVQQAKQAVDSEAWYTKVEDFFGRDDRQQDRLGSLQKQASSLNDQIAQLDRAAAEKLDELNNSAMDAYYALPDSITKNLPPT